MAVKSKDKPARQAAGFRSSTERHLVYGLNVLVMVAVAVVLLVLVNYLGQRHHLRKDLARLGAFVLSDRTKTVLSSLEDDVRISSIYTSSDPEKDYRLYEPDVRDLLDEYRYQSPQVKADFITSDDQKIELIARVRATYGAQAGPYQEALERSTALSAELADRLSADLQRLTDLLEAEPPAWLARFPGMASLRDKLDRGLQRLNETREQVAELTAAGGGMPRYDEAKNVLLATYTQLKTDLQQGKTFIEQAHAFAQAIQSGDQEFFSQTPQRAEALQAFAEQLSATIGKPADELPEAPASVVRAFAQQAGDLARWLEEEAGRLRSFASAHPLVEDHAAWAVYFRLLGTVAHAGDVVDKVQDLREDMANFRAQLRNILQQNPDTEQLRDVVAQLRQINRSQIEPRIEEIRTTLQRLPQELQQIDEQTLAVLSPEQGGIGYQDLIDAVDEMVTQLNELEDLKLEDIADKLREDNVIVIEAGEKARVLGFDDVWPMSVSPWSAFAGQGEDKPRRVFNGDQAISSALIGLTNDQPFATVIITSFRAEPAAGPMGQRMPPMEGSLPERLLNTLRERLEQANLSVKEWNLADSTDPPEPEEGTEPVYLFLPPPPARPPMGMQQMPDRSFGEPERQAVRNVLAAGGRGIFLATFELPRMMNPFMPPSPPVYHYASMLKDDWGIDVQIRERVLKARPDPGHAGLYRITLREWSFLRLSDFTDQPVGKPLKATRCLMNDVCPVITADEPPEGVTIAAILSVPPDDDYWGENDVPKLVSRVLQGEAYVTKDVDDRLSPFPVMVAAENDQDTKIIVAGMGASLLDGYLNERVPRIEEGAILFDPPPSANADLLINAVLWLADKPELIGAGPAIVPPIRPIESGVRSALWVVVMGWSVLALIVGGVMMFVRRR